MPRSKRKGRAVKKNKAKGDDVPEEITRAPHSFVIHRGKTGSFVENLSLDFRKVMEPFTASNLKVRPKNCIKDFAHLAGVLNVSHLVAFTRTERGPYVKFARFPRGPTLTFKIDDYVLARDVRRSLKRQVTYEHQFANHPLLILNGFSSGESQQAREVQLMTSMFQNMFPSINVTTVKLSTIRRCVLLNYDAQTGGVEFRHYTIKVVPVGMSKSVKKLVQGKIPNLSNFDSISDYVAGGGGAGNLSESEAEADEAEVVSVPQALGSRGNFASQKSTVRLVELGPRIRMDLIKIEEGLLDGQVLHHKLISKTDEEKAKIKKKLEERKREKAERKSQQEKNVKRKREEREHQKAKSMKQQKLRDSDDTDEEWYRKEVGCVPGKEDLFGKKRKSVSSSSANDTASKMMVKRFKKSQSEPSRKPRGSGAAAPKFKVKGSKKGGGGVGSKFSKKKGKAAPSRVAAKRR